MISNKWWFVGIGISSEKIKLFFRCFSISDHINKIGLGTFMFIFKDEPKFVEGQF